jgi:Contractile injection system tape measure protein
MARHIIHSQKVFLEIPGKVDAFNFQNRLSALLRNDLPDMLDSLFNKIVSPGEVLRIDSLALDLGPVSEQNFEHEFKTLLLKELEQALSKRKEEKDINSENNPSSINLAQSLRASFIYFLEHGHLPWYSSAKQINDWENELLQNLSEKDWQFIVKWIRDNSADEQNIIHRLVLQFSDIFLEELLSKIISEEKNSWSEIYSDIHFIFGKLPLLNVIVQRNSAWEFLLQNILKEEKVEEIKTALLKLFVLNLDAKAYTIIISEQKEINRNIKTLAVRDVFNAIAQFLNTQNASAKKLTPDLFSVDVIRELVKSDTLSADNGNKELTREDNSTAQMNDVTEELLQRTGPADNSTIQEDDVNEEKFLQHKKLTVDKSNDNQQNDTNEELLQYEKPAGDSSDFEQYDINEELLQNQASASEKNAIDPELIKGGEKENKKLITKKRKKTNEAEGLVFVENSGIVLLHPFLEMYFTELNLMDHKQFIDEGARNRAVILLHYLASGETQVAEFNLVLQKILCGMPLEETLPPAIELSEMETDESKKLLHTVTDYWAPLKNTSIEGLRNTFLQREGKLAQKENGWLLTVEQKTVDILLSKLPWGFSSIHLKWMKEILHVDWA